MPARRTDPPKGLKLIERKPALRVAKEAEIGGLGLDWSNRPGVLDEAGLTEWDRLAEVYAMDATRFREGERAALVAYCSWWSAFASAAADVRDRGPVVEGRSDMDRGRMVKNPATVAMREASQQLRYWARELGLTTDARVRIGLADTDDQGQDDDNPFA
ncbi:phage terminase small subunit P27 family [Streptomyces sp. NA02950]|uniref:phage terminase small subunit P27 family n=1 Tax=Streptomyces sp. NA02950 TaxID=2742137 RepID=UPI001590AE41|nr:phage terminase small subunit P27 family [Streptomyces sp. NA02950]QKV94226.1 phage terminase small subunit P27 family [Streptomyces sp. NA02950]